MSTKRKKRNKKNPERKMKVYSKYVKGGNGYNSVPEIRLCGAWLAKLGFKQGDSIIIFCSINEVTIRPFKTDKETPVNIHRK